jgi:hypothetical protein
MPDLAEKSLLQYSYKFVKYKMDEFETSINTYIW